MASASSLGSFGPAFTGLAGTVGFTVYALNGSLHQARSTSGVSELGTVGDYSTTISGLHADVYVVWDPGGSDPIYTAPDRLEVTVAIETFWFNEGAKQLTSGGTVVWASDTIKARLVDSAVTPDIDATVMTGLTAVGTDQALAGKTKTKDTTNDKIIYTASNPSYTSLTGNEVGSAVIYKFVTNDGDSIPLFCLALTPFTPDGTSKILAFAATGIGVTVQ